MCVVIWGDGPCTEILLAVIRTLLILIYLRAVILVKYITLTMTDKLFSVIIFFIRECCMIRIIVQFRPVLFFCFPLMLPVYELTLILFNILENFWHVLLVELLFNIHQIFLFVVLHFANLLILNLFITMMHHLQVRFIELN